uniref:TOG domain-containing protein n=1 Tax=Panagrellus redivivus TaxID=6233 RepID=A0A7E4VVA8_PANRE
MEPLQEFHGIIATLVADDNAVREAGEAKYNEVPLPSRILYLYQLAVEPSVASDVRDMSLVLLRRLIADKYDDIIAVVPTEFASIKEQLIQSIGTEQTASVRKRMTDVISDIARQTIDDNGIQQWNTVIEFLGHCATGERADLREVAMIIIENVPNVFGINQNQHIEDIKLMFQSNLQFDSPVVRSAAVRAYVAFVVDNEDDAVLVRHLSTMVPDMLRVCEHVATTDDEDDVPLQCMIDLATTVPKALAPYFRPIFELCLKTAGNKDKDDAYRQSSMEILVSLCETAPALVRKQAAAFIEPLVQQCLSMMTELDDDISEWISIDDAEEDIEEEIVSLGETSIDRIACALGPKPVFPPAYNVIRKYISSENWMERHAGIFGLSTIGEGCKRQMEPHIREIVVDALIPMLKDAHPRVRYAACNAIGQMSSDFGPTLQKKCHEVVVMALLERAVDLSCHRVAAHALAAFVNFAEDCPKAIITVYLDRIMEKMQWILDQTFNELVANQKKIVLFQVITTVASIADSSQEHFAKYYTPLMPPLKYILSNSSTEELSELRGKTIECISLIGLAVGRELFAPDIPEIMAELNKPTHSAKDDNASYVIAAWARICKVLREDFAPYLDTVLPTVLKHANFSPELSLLNDEEENEEGWDVVDVGESRLGIHTAGIEDKNTACEMLVCFAREMGTAFAPYVEKVAEFMEGELKFVFHDGVRQSAAEIFPHLFAAVRANGPEYRRNLWSRVYPQLLDALSSESDLETAGEFLFSIGCCIEELGREVVSPQDVLLAIQVITTQVRKYETRRLDRERDSKDDEQDEETQEELKDIIELETAILGRVSDLVHCLFTAFKESLLEVFDPIVQSFAELLKPNRTFQDRQWAICVFDDLIEFGGEGSAQYQAVFVEPILNALSDPYPEVRQAAAYGVGLMGMAPNGIYNRFLAGGIQHLMAMIERPDARTTEEGTVATENAISAVAKILKHSNAVDKNLIIPTFVTWLPVWEDTEETPYVYDFFCDLVEENHPAVLGENHSGLPHVVNVILQVFSHEAIDDTASDLAKQTKQRLAAIIKVLSGNKDLFEAVLQQLKLNSNLQHVLSAILAA